MLGETTRHPRDACGFSSFRDMRCIAVEDRGFKKWALTIVDHHHPARQVLLLCGGVNRGASQGPLRGCRGSSCHWSPSPGSVQSRPTFQCQVQPYPTEQRHSCLNAHPDRAIAGNKRRLIFRSDRVAERKGQRELEWNCSSGTGKQPRHNSSPAMV